MARIGGSPGRRLLDTPLTSGQNKMNAYLHGPSKGPDGLFHLCWVWRDNFGCESNHDPCYARSADLIHWETAAGLPLQLPITIETTDIVDPVPAGGGIINGNVKLGFDSKKRPIVSYHKYDAAGNTQIYNARFEDNAWKIRQATQWDYRWDFSGGGSINFEVRVDGVEPHGQGVLKQTFTHKKYGDSAITLDENSLEPIGPLPRKEAGPPETPAAEPVSSGLEARQAYDLGHGDDPAVRYSLQWETLPRNRDKPREGDPPLPQMLRVLKQATNKSM